MPQSMKTDIPLVQAGFFQPIMQVLESEGVPTRPLLSRSSLHRFDLSNNENYVPVAQMYRLFEDISRREGIDDFFEVFADKLRLKGMSDWFDRVAYSPNLLSAINFAAEFEDVVLTHQRIHLEIDGPVCKYSQYYLDQPQYLGEPNPGREFTDYLDFCLAFNFFRQAGGPDWQPLEIHLQSVQAPNFDKLLPTGYQTKIYLGQATTSIVFPTLLLTVPLLDSDLVDRSRGIQSAPQSLSCILHKLLSSTRDRQNSSHRVMADMLSMSPRTLRRRLQAEGTSFSEVVDAWRFTCSLNLLAQNALRIQEIAEKLGYANASNFERAFKRWTGQTPGVYRDTRLSSTSFSNSC